MKTEGEKEILKKEADVAVSQWVRQMSQLSKTAMPTRNLIISVVIALVAVGLVVEPFWFQAAVDAPVSLLQ